MLLDNNTRLGSSKDVKARDSAKRRREASGGAGSTGYGNPAGSAGSSLKEKRLSQHQAQQFVNNQ